MKKRRELLIVLAGMLLLGGCTPSVEDYQKDTLVNGNSNSNHLQGIESTKQENGSVTEDSDSVNTGQNMTADDNTEGQELKKAPIIVVTPVTKEWYVEESDILLAEAKESLVSVEGEGYEALNQVLSERFRGIDEENYKYLLEAAREDYNFRDQESKEYFFGYYSEERVEIAKVDENVVSLRIYYGDYTGGAHGNYGYTGSTYDVQSGKELSLGDILKDADGFYQTAPQYVADALFETYGEGLFPEYREYVSGSFATDHINWYLSAAGMVITFTPYEVGPYAMGTAEVTLPYEEFGKYLNEKYIGTQSELIAKVPENMDVSAVLGEESKIYLKTRMNEYEMLDVSVISGENEEQLGMFGWVCSTYAIRREDGRSFLIIASDYASDDIVTFVYEVTGGMVKKCAELQRAEVSGGYLSTDKIEMQVYIDVLGTYVAAVDYYLEENGNLRQGEEMYSIDSNADLTIVKPLPAEISGENVLLNVDTKIRITGTNNVDEVYFVVPQTGTTGTIFYEADAENSWIHMIDGVSEYEYFEMLPYAG